MFLETKDIQTHLELITDLLSTEDSVKVVRYVVARLFDIN